MTPAEFEDAKALWKFFYAHECFKQVENACSFIIDNSLDENHPAYYPLVTAIYVLYGKPFKRSNVVGKLPSDIVPWAVTARPTKSESLFRRRRLACSEHSFEHAHPCYRRSWSCAGHCRRRLIIISESCRSVIKRKFRRDWVSTLSTFSMQQDPF
jgi:hypothetical protein